MGNKQGVFTYVFTLSPTRHQAVPVGEALTEGAHMAAKQHKPTKAQAQRIQEILQEVADGRAKFVSHKQYQQWFGRTDSAARQYLLNVWETEFADFSEPLCYIELTDGYVLARSDRQNEWLINLTAEG